VPGLTAASTDPEQIRKGASGFPMTCLEGSGEWPSDFYACPRIQ
jgi:hypothetical protein